MSSNYPAQFGMVGARREHLERLRSYGFRRAEVVMLPPQDKSWLRAYLAGMSGGFSFHCPAFRSEDWPENPLLAALADPDRERRQRSLALMRRELDQAAEWGARHLVVHLQRNLLAEEESETAWGEKAGLEIAVESIGELLEYAGSVGVPVHLENMMGSPLFYRPESYRKLAGALPAVQFCLDVGHAALDGRFFGFWEAEIAKAMGPNLGSMHLYDNQIPATIDFTNLREQGVLNKYPVHPDNHRNPGWIDSPGCLQAALRAQPDALVTFEVYYHLDTGRSRTAEGLDWTVERCRQLAGEA